MLYVHYSNAWLVKLFFSLWLSRYAHPEIPALMEATTAIKMLAATTSDNLQIPCSVVSASLVMLAMAISAERTQTLMDGPMLTWFVWRTPHTTAKRWVVKHNYGSECLKKQSHIRIYWLCQGKSTYILIWCLLYRTTAPISLIRGRKIMIRTALEMLVTMMMTTMAFLMTE